MNMSRALEIMDSGEVFSCTCVNYDQNRKTGGKKRFYSQLVSVSPRRDTAVRQPKKLTTEGKKRDAYADGTRLFFRCIKGEPTSVRVMLHIFLLLEINGEKVML